MKHKNIIHFFLASLLLLSLNSFSSEQPVNFTDLSSHYGEPRIEVNLGTALIGMVSAISGQSDPELAGMLNKLESISVIIYAFKAQPADYALKSMKDMSASLRKRSWEAVASVNEGDKKMRVLTKSSNDTVSNLVLMGADLATSEAAFINVVGEINPADLAKLTKSLNLDIALPYSME